jgi:hypothetical protein
MVTECGEKAIQTKNTKASFAKIERKATESILGVMEISIKATTMQI